MDYRTDVAQGVWMDYRTYVAQRLMVGEKARTPSVQSRFDKQESQMLGQILWLASQAPSLGPVGSKQRDSKLRLIWRNETILAGVIYTQVTRIAAMQWKIVSEQGMPRKVKEATQLLQGADGGAGWDHMVKKWALDYLTADRGALLELGRSSKNGPVTGLYHIDIGRCELTGKIDYPWRYEKADGKWAELRPSDVIHRASLPSSDERDFGTGYCFVSRAIKSAQLLMALHNYEESALSNMPPDGIASVTGVTGSQLRNALSLWQAKRDSQDLTFKRILWLVGDPMSQQPIKVDWTTFSSPPKDWTRQDVIETYVKTLALAAGEDAGEFWMFLHTGATKATGELQYRRAQGKGVGEMAIVLERAMNWEVLPEGIEFTFDEPDDEQDRYKAETHSIVVDTVLKAGPLLGKQVVLDKLVENGIITSEQAELALSMKEEEPEAPDDDVITDQEDDSAAVGESEVEEKSLDDELASWPEERLKDLEARVSKAEEDNIAVFERKARRFELEGEEKAGTSESGWWGPPKGSHGPGSQSGALKPAAGSGAYEATKRIMESVVAGYGEDEFWQSHGGVHVGPVMASVTGSISGHIVAPPMPSPGLRSGVKNELCKTLSAASGVGYEDVDNVLRSWAESSAAGYSLVVQDEVGKLFAAGSERGRANIDSKLKDEMKRGVLDKSKTSADSRATIRKVAQSVYKNTQDYFEERGLGPNDRVRIFRGVATGSSGAGGVAVGQSARISARPIESWTLNPLEARTFGDVVMVSDVRVKDIWSTAMTGAGCLSEWEVIVLGKGGKVTRAQ